MVATIRESPPATALSEESFAFFAALAADNTPEWFHAHAGEYRAYVDRPWRALVAAVAEPVAALLPELDCEVKTGHVLSRIAARWPRPEAAYRTELQASFQPAGEPRRRPRLFLSLSAAGLRAGLEVPARTAAWDAVAGALAREGVREPGPGGSGGWDDAAADLQWWLGRRRLAPGEAVARRGAALWLERAWTPAAAVRTAGLADAVLAALKAAAPWYRFAARASPDADAALLAVLPPSLRAAVAARAAAEGVSAGAYVVYALTRAVGA